MAKENSLGSWIDQERMEELLEAVRPGSSTRQSDPSLDSVTDADLTPSSNVAESLLADEIPKRVFMKGLRPKLPAPEPRPPKAVPADTMPTAVMEVAPDPNAINPLTLYFHSDAPTAEARAKAFVRWARETSGATSAFVVDAYGAAIAAEPEVDPVFLASVSNLADALGRGKDHFSQPDQNALHLEMPEGEILCVVQAKWELATVALGLLRNAPLTRDVAIRYRGELAKLAQTPRRRPRD